MDIRLEEIADAGNAIKVFHLEVERCRRDLTECRKRIEQMEGFFAHLANAINSEADDRFLPQCTTHKQHGTDE
jgi:hypothetical protein